VIPFLAQGRQEEFLDPKSELSIQKLNYQRIGFFEKAAPYYDTLLDLLTFGGYALFLKKAVRILAPQKGEKILDLCSGTGRAASWMVRAVGSEGQVIGWDIAQAMVRVARKKYGGSKNLIFQQKDVTRPWGYQGPLNGIFTSFSLHELPEEARPGVLEQAFSALTADGRLVVADFNPQVFGKRKALLIAFFRLFEKENLSFFDFDQKEGLRKAGFCRIRTLLVSGGLFQMTLARR